MSHQCSLLPAPSPDSVVVIVLYVGFVIFVLVPESSCSEVGATIGLESITDLFR